MYQFKHLGFLLFCICPLLWKWISSIFKPMYKYMYIYVNVHESIKNNCHCCQQLLQTAWAYNAGKVHMEDKRLLSNLELGETKVLPQWSAPMKTQHNGFRPWEFSRSDSAPILLNGRRTSTLINTERFPPTVSSCRFNVKKKRDKLQGFSHTMSSDLSNCSIPRSLFWPCWPRTLT